MTDCAYLVGDLETFKQLADIVFVVEGKRFPAHSQILAIHSKVLADVVREAQPFMCFGDNG